MTTDSTLLLFIFKQIIMHLFQNQVIKSYLSRVSNNELRLVVLAKHNKQPNIVYAKKRVLPDISLSNEFST